MTLQALARHLNLSTTTVSVVISNAPAAQGIPNSTRQRILKAAKDLQYRPNYMARSLRGSRSMSIGILAPDLSEGYFTLVMSGVEGYLFPTNYHYFFASHYNRKHLVEDYTRQFKERGVDGLLLISTPHPTKIDLPMVSISGHVSDKTVTSIVLDQKKAALLALKYLKDLGHRRIAFIRGHDVNVDTDDRWLATVSAAAELKIKVHPELCINQALHSWSPQTGYGPVQDLLHRTRNFTAMFCFNDIVAFGAIRALYDAGLRVPHDVSIVGFDDVVSAAFGIPSLTTIRQPLVEMGRIAAETLLTRIDNPSMPHQSEIVMQPSLVIRESAIALRARGETDHANPPAIE